MAKIKVKKGGVFRTIEANELGIFLNAGYQEVVNTNSPKFEKVLEQPKKKVEEKPVEAEPKAKKKKA